MRRKVVISVISILVVTSISYFVAKRSDTSSEIQVISSDKVKNIDVECLSFLGKNKVIPLEVIDVASDDIIQIFKELKAINFPIYAASCKTARTRTYYGSISLHAYGAAIDVNYSLNPYYESVNKKMIPQRKEDREEDKRSIVSELKKIDLSYEEIKEVVKVVIQPKGSDDLFLNRGVVRKGMVTPEVVSIFRKHGFSEWGGHWRQPIDYMHFQMPRSVAEELAKTNNFEARKKIWEEHKKACRSY